MAAQTDDKKLDGAGLTTLWGIIKQYIADNPSIPKATASVLGGIMVGTTLAIDNSGVLNLASGIVTAGTYKSVTVDTYGRVTAGSNPNTLAGYGITDAKIDNGAIILGADSITPATQTWVQQQGYTSNIGTVTQVKVGTSAYDPSSGVVSLPAYPTTLPASDVYSWAKASSKPSYTASEVGAATSDHTHTTTIATSSGTNQITLAFGTKYAITAGGTSYVFTMPSNPDTWRPLGTGATDACAGNDSRLSNSRPASDVYSWAKASTKPSYSWSEISSRPTALSSFTNDSGYITSSGSCAYAGYSGYTTGYANYLTSQGTVVAASGTGRYGEGLRIGRVYAGSGHPVSYGTTLTMEASNFGAELIFNGIGGGGATGSGQAMFRTHSDWETSEWGEWRTIIDSVNIGSQSVSYATSAGNADTLDGYHHDSFLHITGGTVTGLLSVNDELSSKYQFTLYDSKNNDFCIYWRESTDCVDMYSYENSYHNICLGLGSSAVDYGGLFFKGSNFNWGIGTSSPSYKLHVNGACAATSFPNISDMRKKNIIKDNLSVRLNDIANAPLFDFTWKDVNLDKDLHIGSSAQYWKNVIPEAVTTAQDEMCTLSMQYDVIALASCICIAKETVTLKEKVALLETRVESLEKKIREYESN